MALHFSSLTRLWIEWLPMLALSMIMLDIMRGKGEKPAEKMWLRQGAQVRTSCVERHPLGAWCAAGPPAVRELPGQEGRRRLPGPRIDQRFHSLPFPMSCPRCSLSGSAACGRPAR